MKRMEKILFIFALAVLAGVSTSSKISPRAVCPASVDDLSCTCEIYDLELHLRCSGSSVSQASLEEVFRRMRDANGLASSEQLQFRQLDLSGTDLTRLDLTPFLNLKLQALNINSNSLLSSIVGPPLNTSSAGQKLAIENLVDVANLFIDYSPLNYSGFGDTLKYFSDSMEDLGLFHLESLRGATNDELLPGLYAKTNLTYLYLVATNFSQLEGGQFKTLTKLTGLELERNNLKAIGENAFLFDTEGASEEPFTIHLNSNYLNEDSFHPNSGLSNPGRWTNLNLEKNDFTTLPASIFEPFFDSNPANLLLARGNPLFCDSRVSWLKKRREELESRVLFANCENDQGNTVFNSTLVP